MGLSIVGSAGDLEELFATCKTLRNRAFWWKSKVCLLHFLQVFAFSNQFFINANPNALSALKQLIMDFLCDSRFDVRAAAAETLEGLIRADVVAVDHQFLEKARDIANSTNPIKLHSGILALSAIVRAFPYSVPYFLPNVLEALDKDYDEFKDIVKRALNEFFRTHRNEWERHSSALLKRNCGILKNLTFRLHIMFNYFYY